MECPNCGYVMSALDGECPRCNRNPSASEMSSPPHNESTDQQEDIEAIRKAIDALLPLRPIACGGLVFSMLMRSLSVSFGWPDLQEDHFEILMAVSHILVVGLLAWTLSIELRLSDQRRLLRKREWQTALEENPGIDRKMWEEDKKAQEFAEIPSSHGIAGLQAWLNSRARRDGVPERFLTEQSVLKRVIEKECPNCLKGVQIRKPVCEYCHHQFAGDVPAWIRELPPVARDVARRV